MKRSFTVWCAVLALAAAGAARAQLELEKVPDEQTKKVAVQVAELIPSSGTNAGITFVSAPEKAIAYKAGKLAFLLTPDRELTAKSVTDAGNKSISLGWLALRGTVPVLDGKVAPPAVLATARPADSQPVTFLFFGVHKDGEKRILDVYSRDGMPMLKLPLTHVEKEPETPLDIKLANLDRETKQVDCVLTVLGGYTATVRLGAAPQ